MLNNNSGGNSLFGTNNNNTANNIYQELAMLRAASGNNMTAYNQYRTVFNDISDEWTNCSEEERKFIEKDDEYMTANLTYAQQFNAFLIDQFGLQFTNSKYGASAEKVLVALRNAKGRFHSSTIEDMNKIKNENAMLQKQLKELEELINCGDK